MIVLELVIIYGIGFQKVFGGKNAIDYLIQVEGYTFLEATQILMEKTQNQKLTFYNNLDENVIKKDFILPLKNNNYDKTIAYLTKRGIDKDIIGECIKNNLIYEEKDTHNAVFVGYDKNKNPRYAFCRGTSEKRFMKEAKGSDKKYSFRLNFANKSNRVHLFESSIDLLSYATLMKIKNLDFRKENLLSLAGVYAINSEKSKNNKLQISVKNFLEENSNITEIFLHLDNDEVGRIASKNLQEVLSKKYTVIDKPVPYGKDCNDYLCYVLEIKNCNKNANEKVLKGNNLLAR